MKRTYEVVCKGRSIAPPNWINYATDGCNRLYYIEGGTGGYIEDGKRVDFEAGKLYFIPYYADVVTYQDIEDRIDHSFVTFKLSPPIISRKVFALDPHVDPKHTAALGVFRELCKTSYLARTEKDSLTPEKRLEMEFLMAATVYLSECAVSTNPDMILNDQAVTLALETIHKDTAAKLTVAEIAAMCNMSNDGFIRKFTRYIGETPYSYIKKLKVRRALTLRQDGVTLQVAAEACGYSDPSALSHAIMSLKNNHAYSTFVIEERKK
jgi:AraC-like DNA-binding protein